MRYVRDCANGNTVNAGNQWVEIQVIKDGVNIAKGKTVTGITNNETYPLTRITDGTVCTESTCYAVGAAGSCATIDLGSAQNIDEIGVWHYWLDGRTYYDNVTSVSTNNTNWIDVIDKPGPASLNGKHFSAWN